MLGESTYVIATLSSALWFAAAFRYFSFQHVTAAKVLVPKSARQSPLFDTVAALARFLGGMNAALSLLSAILLVIWVADADLFTSPTERLVILTALGAAHFSQFAFNVPVISAGERQGEALWNVLSGPMRFIFYMDAAQAAVCFIAAIAQITVS